MFDDTKKRRLNTSRDCKRFLSRLINEANAKKLKGIEIKQFRAICYAVNIIGNLIRTSEIEEKIKKLERLINEKIG